MCVCVCVCERERERDREIVKVEFVGLVEIVFDCKLKTVTFSLI